MPSLFDFINDMVKSKRSSEDEEPASATLPTLLNWPDLGIPAVTRGDVLAGGSGSANLVGGSGDDDLKAATADGVEEKRFPSPSDARVKEPAKARHDASPSADPGPEDAGGAGPIDPKTLTGEQVLDALQVPKDPAVFAKGDWKKKMESTLEALAELDRTNPGRAKEIRAKVSALHEARAKAAAKPTGADEVRDRVTPTATAKILPDGNRTVVVNATTPKKGATLPADSVRVSDKEMTPDEMLATLHGIAANINDRTDQERETATALAYRLERLQETNPKAFGKLPGELQNFLGFFKEKMDDERAAIVPKNLKDTTTEVPPDAWKKMTKDSADYAMWRTVRSFLPAPVVGRSAEGLAEFASGWNDLFGHNETAAGIIERLRQWGGERKEVPKEYWKDGVLKKLDALDRIRRNLPFF